MGSEAGDKHLSFGERLEAAELDRREARAAYREARRTPFEPFPDEVYGQGARKPRRWWPWLFGVLCALVATLYYWGARLPAFVLLIGWTFLTISLAAYLDHRRRRTRRCRST